MPIPVWSSHSFWYDKELRLALYSNWEGLLKCMKMLKSAATRLTVCTSIIYIIYNKSFRKWLPLHIWSHQVKSSTTKICKLQISKTSPTHMITKYSIEVRERKNLHCIYIYNYIISHNTRSLQENKLRGVRNYLSLRHYNTSNGSEKCRKFPFFVKTVKKFNQNKVGNCDITFGRDTKNHAKVQFQSSIAYTIILIPFLI